jgi:pimeloyl-ACP methyl ester carboxylesterase
MTERLQAFSGRRFNTASNGPGEGMTILFLHGVLRNWRSFYELYQGLHQEFRLHALDFRGHGKSDRFTTPYLTMSYVEDALALLRQRPAGRVLIYGHSLGAMVALALAALEPSRVAAIVLEDPPFSTLGTRFPGSPQEAYFQGVRSCLAGPRDPEMLYQCFSEIIVGEKMDGTPVRVRDQRDELSRRFSAESLTLVDPRVLNPILAGGWLTGYDLSSLARRVRCPTHVLQADAARGGMLDDAEVHLLTLLLGAHCHVMHFAGSGHHLHGAHAPEIVELIRFAALGA